MEKEQNNKGLIITICILVIAIIVIIFFALSKIDNLQLNNSVLNEKIKINEKDFKLLNSQIKVGELKVDSLKNIIELESKEDKQIKIIHDEKIRMVNLYSISEQQQYFDVLTGKANKGSNIR